MSQDPLIEAITGAGLALSIVTAALLDALRFDRQAVARELAESRKLLSDAGQSEYILCTLDQVIKTLSGGETPEHLESCAGVGSAAECGCWRATSVSDVLSP